MHERPTDLVNTVNSIPQQRRTHVGSLFDVLAWFLRHDHKLALLRNGIVIVRFTGLRATRVRILRRVYNVALSQEASPEALFSPAELKAQREVELTWTPLVSVIVPLYNTPEPFLTDMLDSVMSQTYPNWELCLADGSDANHPEVERVCREYAHDDARIRYRRLLCNGGISANTNACLEIAQGDFVALLDHDDMLHPAALFEVVKALGTTGADFVYTDEGIFSRVPGDLRLAHYKPCYGPDSLISNNYICHFSVIRRTLLDAVGPFCAECDGSQDHDMVMRITEKSTRIAHIPEILYWWRAHMGSAAQSMDAKPYAVQAGIRAVERSLARRGLSGEVTSITPSVPIYRVRYEIEGSPKVSVVVTSWADGKALWACLRSILRMTSYKNYEVIVLDCGTGSHRMKPGLRCIRSHDVRVIHLKGDVSLPQATRTAVSQCGGEYVLLLAGDLEVAAKEWVQELLMYAQREDVGAAGGKILTPEGTIRQAGLCLGVADPAASFFHDIQASHNMGYMGRLAYTQNVTAISAECMMMRRTLWDALGGMDPAFDTKLADADMCMRLHNMGKRVVWTPFAELHGLLHPIPNVHGHRAMGLDDWRSTRRRINANDALFRHRWEQEIRVGDRAYNPNMLPDRQDFTVFPVTWTRDVR